MTKKEHKPLDYIERTRYYYQKLGYGKPYEWARYDDVPFTTLSKPLAECTVGIVTTAAPYNPEYGDQRAGAPYNSAAKFFTVYQRSSSEKPDLRISHIAIDRKHTRAEDMGSYFPMEALSRAHSEGRIGSLASHFYGLPSNRSKRISLEKDCAALLSLCQADYVDVALLVPNCPVCHQSVSLAARTLEDSGIVTVVIGCAKDIVENVGVPRFLFNNLPLGNSAGLPHNKESQYLTLTLALALADSATVPRTTVHTPLEWPGDANWQDDYSNPDKLSAEELERRRVEFDKAKAVAKSVRKDKRGRG